MTPEQIKEKLLAYTWERWLERHFGGFILSLFIGGNARSAMKMIGVDVEHVATLYEEGAWHESEDVYKLVIVDVAKEVAKGFRIRRLSAACEHLRDEQRIRIMELVDDNRIGAIEKLRKVVDTLKTVTTHIWFAHDYEYYLTPILKREIPKYFTGDIDKLIGDLSFPERKNAHNFLEEELLGGADLNELVQKYGWIKARDSFSDPFTVAELGELKENLLKESKPGVERVKIPQGLKQLISEARELVYYRTLRTDVFYELLFVARPIMEAAAKSYGLTYQELRNYSVHDLLVGKLVEYPDLVTCAYYKDEAAFFSEPILSKQKLVSQEIKGTVAYSGKARGVVKVVREVGELGKVHDGDVLVTFMTAPSHISAMKKAVAFVTDEGGITCHAAIVARELQKPCIIGTKIATQVLKDGDLVEVDAEKGIVMIINQNDGKK
jgi:phosphohistidine swiveling domain-containing protein